MNFSGFKSFFTTFLAVLLGTITMVLIYRAIVFLWPYNPININSVELKTPTVEAGHEVMWKLSYCKEMSTPGAVYRQLTDAEHHIWIIASGYGLADIGCDSADLSLPIPITAKAGIYKVENTIVYNVNSLRSITVKYSTPEFMVTEPETIIINN